jgi:outer membrane protein TolC
MKLRYLFLTIAGVAFAGCQSYEEKPLDLKQIRTAWKARSPNNQGVKDYAGQLAGYAFDKTAEYDPSDGLSVKEAEILALFFNPDLREARSKANIALASAREAGRWEDPELGVSAARILKSVANPWEYEVELGFTIPISGSLGLERDTAHAESDAAMLEVYAEECSKIIELREKWQEWSVTLEKIGQSKKFLGELEAVLEIADKLAAGGELGKIDARLFTIEKAVRLDELKVLEDTAHENKLEIKSMLGMPHDRELKLIPDFKTETESLSLEEKRKKLEEHNPELNLLRAEYETAEKTLKLEIRKQYPDLGFGLTYENAEGPSSLGPGLSIPLPFFNRNRQAIAEARAARAAARIAFESSYEKLVSELVLGDLKLKSAAASRKRLENEIAPLVDQQLKDARKIAELGEFDALLTLEALTQSLETKHQLAEAHLLEALAKNRINALVNPRFRMPRKSTEDKK